MTPLPPGWGLPRCESRTGAAHLRRGTACQDASGIGCFLDADGEPLQALVVSDGHGGARYDRSEVGSRLACRVTLEEIRSQLAGASLRRRSDLAEWRRWLAQALPARLLERWRSEVLRHAAAHPRPDGAAPATIPYGATLGVLLLTPRWWGYTGLGDWDLVRIGRAGEGALLSEEPALPGGGEATFSLCMEGAERHFAARSDLLPIEAGQEPFQLLLSSDGIRKSCGSDADFLALARHLSVLEGSAQGGDPLSLAEALDHISRQGSGDDVSVAIARWGACDQPLQDEERPGVAPQAGQRRSGGLRIVQPGQPAAEAAAAAGPGAAALRPADALAGQAARARAGRAAGEGAGEETAEERGEAGDGAQSMHAGRLPPPPRSPLRRRLPPALLAGLVLCALALSGAAAAVLLGWSPLAGRNRGRAPADPLLPAALRQEAARLCGPTPDAGAESSRLSRITDTLNQRRSTFRALQQGAKSAGAFLSAPAQDPTGALIAWSVHHPGLEASPPFCAELRLALQRQWQRERHDRRESPSR